MEKFLNKTLSLIFPGVLFKVCVCMCACSVVSSSLWPVDCIPPGCSVHGIVQVRILESVAISVSRDLFDPGIKSESLASPGLAGGFFTEPPAKPPLFKVKKAKRWIESSALQGCETNPMLLEGTQFQLNFFSILFLLNIIIYSWKETEVKMCPALKVDATMVHSWLLPTSFISV